jgi:GNAT superfamily N-acetyltransferase
MGKSRNSDGERMIVRESQKTLEDFTIIVDMAEYHPYPEYDCSFEEWKIIFENMFKSPKLRAWIALEGDIPVGYIIGIRDTFLKNQISVFDIYLKSDYRGKNLITLLVSRLRDWAIEDKAKRIQWTSKFNAEKWQSILEKTVSGIKVDEYKTLCWEVV